MIASIQRRVAFCVTSILILTFARVVLAHGPGLEKAEIISNLLAEQGDQAELYLERGKVY